MKTVKIISAVAAMLSSQAVFSASCDVLQSKTIAVAENNQTGIPFTAAAIIGGVMDMSPYSGSQLDRDNPVEMYLEGVRIDPETNGIASLDEINWWSQDFVLFGSASTKNFRLVINFEDGTSTECEEDIEVRYDDADPVIRHTRYDISETPEGYDVEVWADLIDSDGAEFVNLEYELVSGPNVALPDVVSNYDPVNAASSRNVNGQLLSFTEPGSYSLRLRATDENGNTNVSYETAEFEIDGSCMDTTNAAHIAAGRAYDFFGFTYATGSNQWIGYSNESDASILQQTIPGWWFPVLVCL
ncbi:MAG: hypothetical protein K6L76_01315 [Agarilytica sp.]